MLDAPSDLREIAVRPLSVGVHYWRIVAVDHGTTVGQSIAAPIWISSLSTAAASSDVIRPVFDSNNDGWPDLISCSERQCAVIQSVIRAAGMPQPDPISPFTAQPPAVPEPRPSVAGDTNGDGVVDVMIRRDVNWMLEIRAVDLLLGRLSGRWEVDASFSARSFDFLSVSQPTSADFSGDGIADVIDVTPGFPLVSVFLGGHNRELLGRQTVELTAPTMLDGTVRLYRAASGSRLAEVLVVGRSSPVTYLILAVDAANSRGSIRRVWSAGDELFPAYNNAVSTTVRPIGDLNRDGYPELLFAGPALRGSEPPTTLVAVSRATPSGVEFQPISVSLPIFRDTRLVDVVGPIDLDADGEPEFLYVTAGYEAGSSLPRYHRSVIRANWRNFAGIEVLSYGYGSVACQPPMVECGFWGLRRSPVPVAGDFDRDGYDDLIAPTLDGAGFEILRGGPDLNSRSWQPLTLPQPVAPAVIGVLAG